MCGQVKWTATESPAFSGYCYCGHCRRMSGAGRSPFIGFDAAGISISGEIRYYTDSSDEGAGIERYFCPTCGTRLFSIPGSAPHFRIFYAGSLDDPDSFEPAFSIHVAGKVAWETIPDGLEAFDGDAPG
nr:GFA family protein [Paracoccus amoyensis]